MFPGCGIFLSQGIHTAESNMNLKHIGPVNESYRHTSIGIYRGYVLDVTS